MASTAMATTALLLSLNLLFFSLVSYHRVACPPTPKTPNHSSPSPPKATCPKNTLKFAACAEVFKGMVHLVVGTPPKTPCCSLIEGLADLEAAVCLCTAIKASVLGSKLNVPVSLSLLLNYCGKGVPKGFKCS